MPLPESLARLEYHKVKARLFRLHKWVSIPLPDVLPICESEMVVVTFRDSNSRLAIHDGFEWNGASGPTWDSESIRRAALVHDALYHLLREGALDQKYRKRCDTIFRHLLKAGGVNPLRRAYYYLAVRMFGGKAARCRS